MSNFLTLELMIFIGVTCFVGLVAIVASPAAKAGRRSGSHGEGGFGPGRNSEEDDFWDDALAHELRDSPRLKKMLLPRERKGARQLGERLIQAGLYKRDSFIYFSIVRVVLMLVFPGIGLLLWSAGMMTMTAALLSGSIAGIAAMILPSFYLDSVKKKRQSEIRRALPDALDVINICLEGGMSLSGAFHKVTAELKTAYPMLAAEFAIIQREVQMGRTTGEALRNCAKRFDLEELRSLASVVLQSEKFGASVVQAMKVHASSLRVRRMQHAEEMAQKASVKILLPTLLLIFPALFVVILGPAAFDVVEMLKTMSENR